MRKHMKKILRSASLDPDEKTTSLEVSIASSGERRTGKEEEEFSPGRSS